MNKFVGISALLVAVASAQDKFLQDEDETDGQITALDEEERQV